MPNSLPHLLSLLALGGLLALAHPAAAQRPRNDTVDIDKSHYTLFNPTPRRYMRPMVPDRPGITESPYSVDAGHFQYETDALRLLTRHEGGRRRRDWYLNHALLKMGLTDRTDFQVELDSYTSIRTNSDDAPAERYRGFGDVSLRLKHTLVGDDDSRTAVAGIAYVLLPSGGAVGEGGAEVGAVVPVVVQLTKDWSAGGQLEGTLLYDRDEARRYLQLTPTLTADYQFTKFAQAFVELVGYRDVRQSRWRGSLNLGPQLDFGDNLQVDFGAHLPLTSGVDHEYFVGLSFRR